MSDEQRLILKMLEEGKISAAEAEALLNALGQPEVLEEEERSADVWEKVEKQGEDFAKKVESAAERFARNMEEKVEPRLADKLSRLSKMLSRFPFVSTDDTYEFSEEFYGTFQEDGDIALTLKTSTGRISVQGWNEPQFRLVVVQRIRAKDRESALGKMYRVELPSEEALRELSIDVPSFPDTSVSLVLSVPRTVIYQLGFNTHSGSISVADLYTRTARLTTSVGSIEVQGLQGESIECTTVNGSCRAEQITAESFVGRTGNGSLKLKQLQGEKVDCETSNGSIRVEPVVRGTAHYTLNTTNGSIRIVQSDAEVKTAFDLYTTVGRISVPEEAFEITNADRRSGGWHLAGKSPGFEGGANRLHLHAKTGSGSIRLDTSGGGQD
ncbi:MAG: hypothetical protein AA931_00595 [Peptococcaceae bacterium 1109]|nr:MAG: hypothetical protein AA931_00595 [Peptococcaceae bacterium 1109]